MTSRGGEGGGWLAPLALVLFLLALFWRVLAGEVFYNADFSQFGEPLRHGLAEAFRNGRLPLFSPDLGNGRPLLANPVAGTLYPPNLLFALPSAAHVLTLLTLLHLVFGALGVHTLAKRLSATPAGALAAGFAFAASGTTLSSLSYIILQVEVAWIPWLLVGLLDIRERPVRSALLVAAAVASLLMNPEPFTLFSAAIGGLLLLSRESAWRWGPKPLGALVLGTGLGILGALPFLVAVARYVPSTVRRLGFKIEGLLQWSLHPAELLGVLVPEPFGDASLYTDVGFWGHQLVPGRATFYFATLYVGALALCLAIVPLGRRTLWLALWLAISVGLALGQHGPFLLLYQHAPGFDSLRYPIKWLAPAMVPFALLVGLGTSALDDESGRRRFLAPAFSALGVLAALALSVPLGLDRWLASLAGGPAPGEAFLVNVRARVLNGTLQAAVPVALLALVVFFRPRLARPAPLGAIATALLALDLAVGNGSATPTTDARFYDLPPTAKAILSDPGPRGRVYVETPAEERIVRRPRSMEEHLSWERQALKHYTAAAYGLHVAFDNDVEACAPVPYMQLKQIAESAPLRERLMLLGTAGVTHVVTTRLYDTPHVTLLAELPGPFTAPVRIYRNRLAQPRARVVAALSRYQTYRDLTRAVAQGPDDLFSGTAFVEEALADRDAPGAPASPGTATVERDDGHRLAIRTRGGGGALVVSDVLVPGWSAEIDGRPARLLRADFAFRAVPLPPGEHVVTFRYNPFRQP